MEYSEVKTSIVPSPNSTLVPNPFSSSSPSCSSPPPPPTLPHSPPPPMVVMSPCAACKILRRRCAEKCVLAPYFPPTEPLKFTTAHRVFGASNIIKLLQELPESQRADAVSSMVYEANARVRDPIYGCAGAICHLQKQISELQAQLAKTQADLLNMQCQQEYLLGLLDVEMGEDGQNQFQISPLPLPQPCEDSIFFSDVDAGIGMGAWKPLWT